MSQANDPLTAYRELWDWRCRIADLYAALRELEHPRLAWQLWRETRDELFRSHPQSPLDPGTNATFRRVPLFDYDPAFRFAVELRPASGGEPVTLSGGGDGTIRMRPFALTSGLAQRLGGELTLYWIGGYGGGVFLPLKDATSGRETYGGGRYLLDTVKSADLGRTADGRTILDFNFAYNPSCAWSDRWTCPLAPPENTLPAAVRAGERLTASG
ncbi:MAG TPA: DUF1684 domain-containing protein [Geminicoccaceae bacterium]|nr:DUF1684 domain-containing protein [Geminicoccaceae bacterium]